MRETSFFALDVFFFIIILLCSRKWLPINFFLKLLSFLPSAQFRAEEHSPSSQCHSFVCVLVRRGTKTFPPLPPRAFGRSLVIICWTALQQILHCIVWAGSWGCAEIAALSLPQCELCFALFVCLVTVLPAWHRICVLFIAFLRCSSWRCRRVSCSLLPSGLVCSHFPHHWGNYTQTSDQS